MLPDFLTAAYRTGTTVDARGEPVALRDAVLPAEARLLHDTVRRLRPEVSLEVGFGQGMSTLAILGALSENGSGHHHVIDPHEHAYGDAGLAAVAAAGLAGLMTFHDQGSEYVIPHLPALDFVFVDASHLFDLTIADFVLADRRLRVGGLIGFHDLWLPSYQQVLDYVLSNRPYAPYNWAGGAARRGWAARWLRRPRRPPVPNLAILRKTADDARRWDFHVRF